MKRRWSALFLAFMAAVFTAGCGVEKDEENPEKLYGFSYDMESMFPGDRLEDVSMFRDPDGIALNFIFDQEAYSLEFLEDEGVADGGEVRYETSWTDDGGSSCVALLIEGPQESGWSGMVRKFSENPEKVPGPADEQFAFILAQDEDTLEEYASQLTRTGFIRWQME